MVPLIEFFVSFDCFFGDACLTCNSCHRSKFIPRQKHLATLAGCNSPWHNGLPFRVGSVGTFPTFCIPRPFALIRSQVQDSQDIFWGQVNYGGAFCATSFISKYISNTNYY